MIVQISSGVNREHTKTPRTPITTLRPTSAPTVTAGVVYRDHALGLVLHSIRRDGIHLRSNSIQWDADIIDQAENMGVVVVEVATQGRTYSATIETLRGRGRYVTTRYGLQMALALKWWSTDGVMVASEQQKAQQPIDLQLNLFEMSA